MKIVLENRERNEMNTIYELTCKEIEKEMQQTLYLNLHILCDMDTIFSVTV